MRDGGSHSRCVELRDTVEIADKATRCRLAKCPLADKGDPRCAGCTGPQTWRDESGRLKGGRITHRSCHNCPMNGKGLPVCAVGCAGPVDIISSDGESMVRLGGFDNPGKVIEERMSLDARLSRLSTADAADGIDMPKGAAEYALRLVRMFAALSRPQVLHIHGLLNGMSSAEAARAAGVTKQAGHTLCKRAAQRFPELITFFWAMRKHSHQRGCTPKRSRR